MLVPDGHEINLQFTNVEDLKQTFLEKFVLVSMSKHIICL